MKVVDTLPPPYSDRCPDGCQYEWPEAETPFAAAVTDSGGYLANYRCSRCGVEWACCWGSDRYDEADERMMRDVVLETAARSLPMLPPGGRRYPTVQAQSA